MALLSMTPEGAPAARAAQIKNVTRRAQRAKRPRAVRTHTHNLRSFSKFQQFTLNQRLHVATISLGGPFAPHFVLVIVYYKSSNCSHFGINMV